MIITKWQKKKYIYQFLMTHLIIIFKKIIKKTKNAINSNSIYY